MRQVALGVLGSPSCPSPRSFLRQPDHRASGGQSGYFLSACEVGFSGKIPPGGKPEQFTDNLVTAPKKAHPPDTSSRGSHDRVLTFHGNSASVPNGHLSGILHALVDVSFQKLLLHLYFFFSRAGLTRTNGKKISSTNSAMTALGTGLKVVRSSSSHIQSIAARTPWWLLQCKLPFLNFLSKCSG
jgi:hypothetical protein